MLGEPVPVKPEPSPVGDRKAASASALVYPSTCVTDDLLPIYPDILCFAPVLLTITSQDDAVSDVTITVSVASNIIFTV